MSKPSQDVMDAYRTEKLIQNARPLNTWSKIADLLRVEGAPRGREHAFLLESLKEHADLLEKIPTADLSHVLKFLAARSFDNYPEILNKLPVEQRERLQTSSLSEISVKYEALGKVLRLPPTTLSKHVYASLMDSAEWGTLVNWLRYFYLAYQNLHWLSQGKDFYGDHKMYEGFVEILQSEIDRASERAIGYDQNQAVSLQDLSVLLGQSEISVEQIASAEQSFMCFLTDVERQIDPVGLRNLLGEIADEHEGILYQLRQRLKA